MNSIICLSYNPFLILFSANKNLNSFNYISNSLSYYKILKENIVINSIIYLSTKEFFICSKNFIYHYEYKDKLKLLSKIYTGIEIIKNGIYDNNNNNRIYVISNKNLYIYCNKDKKKICCFQNIINITVDKYRYYSFSKDGFLIILKYLSFCIFSTKNHIKKCIELIWSYKNSLHFKFYGVYKGKYIFSLKDNNLKTELIIIHSSTFLMEIIDITNIIQNNNYNFLLDNFLYLIIYNQENNIIKINYYSFEQKLNYLFSHEIFFQDNIKKFRVYSFYYYHIVYINNRVQYLFNIQEKLSNQLIMEMNKNINIEKQLQYYHNILSSEIKKIENDISIKRIAKCCICYENNVNIIFFPCSHICCCSKCININSCPMCREFILYKKFCYILTN